MKMMMMQRQARHSAIIFGRTLVGALFGFLLMASSCFQETIPPKFKGTWEVLWSVPDNLFGEKSDTLEYFMRGRMVFLGEDSLEVWSYGNSHCVLGRDTVHSTLAWRYTADTLWIGNEEDSQLGYAMVRTSQDTIYMQMFDEVFLRLTQVDATGQND